MEQPLINEQLVRRYLLDDLPQRERERLEVGLLTDDRYYETLTALEDEVEDDLIDEYLDGELTGTERENFERVFLSNPDRAHKLKVIKDLKAQVAVAAPSPAPVSKIVNPNTYNSWIPAFAIFQNPIFGLSTATALTLALLACVWLWMRSANLEAQLREARAQPSPESTLKDQVDQLNRRNEQLAADLQRSEHALRLERSRNSGGPEIPPVAPPDQPSPRTPSTFASVMLSPIVRSVSANIPTLTLGSDHTEGRLYLNVQRVNTKDYKRVFVFVKKQSGDEIWRNDNLKLQSRGRNARAVLIIPAENLAEGQYESELHGIAFDGQTDPLGRYFFRVVHK